MIKVSRLKKEFKGHTVLDELDLEVFDGEIMAILGASGTGKSVLLRHLIGLIPPDSGDIKINSVSITKLSEGKLLKIRKDIGYLFQEGALYDFMNVFDNIAFPLKEHTNLDFKNIRDKVRNVLNLVDLVGVEEQFPAELSGGMKKRVGLARAIVLDSKILFCDEPTSGLDPIRSRDISNLIRNISKKLNCTTVITSHDLENSFRIADRVAIMDKGKITAIGNQRELKANQNPFVREFIGADGKQ